MNKIYASQELSQAVWDAGMRVHSSKVYNHKFVKEDKSKLMTMVFTMGSILDSGGSVIYAPELHVLQEYFREKERIFVNPIFIAPDTNKWQYRIDSFKHNNFQVISKTIYESHRECLEAGLLQTFLLTTYKGYTTQYPADLKAKIKDAVVMHPLLGKVKTKTYEEICEEVFKMVVASDRYGITSLLSDGSETGNYIMEITKELTKNLS